ncbi:hypothetical protein SD81_022550 [Tolypothrix campylonemoides VB511288]|nr:hypothetical protein SD81_022550 [Tolypothrix campylonemoides VB511288]
MVSKPDKEEESGQISRQAVEWLLKQIIDIPRNWLIVISIFILLSTFQINWGQEKSFKFQVNNTTAVFVALTWLPSVLKIFALTGGALKTPAGEITGSSMMPMLRSLSSDSLGFLIEQTKLAEDGAPPQQQLELRQMRHEWQKVYASRVPASEARQLSERLAEHYKELRKSMPYGAQRTFEMESIAGRMRALAPQLNFTAKEILDLLQSPDQGKRLLGLSVAESSGDAIYFDAVLHLINHSETAFEQTCALRAVQKMLSKLDTQQKEKLVFVLNEQRNHNPEEKRWIKPDSNRWLISDRILSTLQV